MKKEILIGRDTEICQIHLPETNNPRTSRLHASLIKDDQGQLWLTDRSTHGTAIRDKRTQKGKPYSVNWGDKVSFANEQPLDWREVEKYFGPTHHHHKETGMRSAARSMFQSLVSWEEKSDFVNLFFEMFPSPSSGLYRYLQLGRWLDKSPIGFYLFGLTVYFFVFKHLKENWGFDGLKGEFIEFLFPLLLGIFVILGGVFQYKMFETFCNKSIGKRLYLSAITIFAGFYYIVSTFFFLPSLLGFESENVMALSLFLVLFWMFYHNIRLHGLLWGISWWRSFFFVGLSILVFVLLILGLAVLLFALFNLGTIPK